MDVTYDNNKELLEEVLAYLRRGAGDESSIHAVVKNGEISGAESRRLAIALKVKDYLTREGA